MEEKRRIDALTEQVRLLSIQIQDIQQDLQHPDLQHRENTAPLSTKAPKQSHTFKIGDRVRIKNNILSPKQWNRTQEYVPSIAKQATVTKVTTSRINFTTDYGIHTWRSPANLSPL